MINARFGSDLNLDLDMLSDIQNNNTKVYSGTSSTKGKKLGEIKIIKPNNNGNDIKFE